MPNSFAGCRRPATEHGSGSALLYFSFTTLTTAGYGDITPLNPLARNLANLESVIGQLFPATLWRGWSASKSSIGANSKSQPTAD